MPYKHVLAAVDLSRESNQVIEKARATADSHGARLSLISVVKPITQVYAGLDLVPISNDVLSLEKEVLNQASAQLLDFAKTYRIDDADVYVELGAPAHKIRDAASEREADLIVIGTHGRHGFELLLGSTANGVLHGVSCDVLAVRVKAPEYEAPCKLP